MSRFEPAAHTLLRVVSGFLFIFPGTMKIFGWFGGVPGNTQLPPHLIAAGVIELVAGTLVLVGFFTRAAAFVASGEMAFAYFIGHFPHGFWPIQNHGEPAVLFCFIFLYLAAAGAGPVSLDALRARRRKATR